MLLFALVLSALLSLQDPATPFRPSVYGLELPVRDVRAAERAYVDGLGFRAVYSGGELARLEKDGLALVLVRSDAPAASADAASVYLNLETHDLARAVERALAAGLAVPEREPRTNPIGRDVRVLDPDGHGLNLMELDSAPTGGDGSTSVFNVGLDLESGVDWEFVERLGLRVLTRKYLPDALPVERAGAAELVLHRRAKSARAAGTSTAALLLGVERLEPAVAALAPLGFADAAALPRATPVGRRLALKVPSNLRVELVERSPGQLAFERLCALAGSWEGSSSEGWSSRCELEVIARGSALLERTNFEAHAGETMLTLYHKDGAELVLTHYCVAGNQPRLVASEIGADALHFTFRDATNLASRDQGHMDEALVRLEGLDAFSSRWSYYQNGKTSWAEEIRYRRLPLEAGKRPAR